MVGPDQFRPTLTTEETAKLRAVADPLASGEATLMELEELGADVAADLEAVRRQRALADGLLERFSAKRPRARRVRQKPQGD